ncbi:hypothetical protein AZ013_000628 [Citrobacter freundii]|nr:hypothetical protein AZ013_000628 [Citrobacter freundii]
MRQHDSCSIETKRRLHHLTGMNLHMVYRTGKQRFTLQLTMLIIKIEHHKHFPLLSGQL